MKRQRIIEILSVYRPDEDLESDPEVRQALDAARQDPDLEALLQDSLAFDEAFAAALDRASVPDGLEERILRQSPVNPAHDGERGILLRWIHPASFAAAAAIIIMLALTFTYWTRPQEAAPPLELAGDPLSAAAHSLYASLNPSFKSRDGTAIRDYLQSRSGVAPAQLPGNVLWDKAFACDVVEVDGYSVSIVCFRAPDNSRSMHLFTFRRGDFPDMQFPSQPRLRQEGSACSATWASGEEVHVLYSDKGEKNLRSLLDI